MQTGIYTITNIINNKIYVGSTTISFNKRFNQHKYLLRKNKHHCNYLQNSWNKYGEHNFKFEILDLVLPEFCLSTELYWINMLNTRNISNGYNINNPEKGRLGILHTEESKKKMSLAQLGNKSHMYGKKLSKEHIEILKNFHTGKKISEETKLKMSLSRKGTNLKENNPFYGKKHTEETKEKLRKISSDRWKTKKHPNLGKKASDELKEKLSISHKGLISPKRKVVYQYSLNMEFIKKWSCAKEAALFYNKSSESPIQACCSGRTRKAFGYIWSYIEF